MHEPPGRRPFVEPPPPAPPIDIEPAREPEPYRPRITHLPSYLISRFLAFVIDVFGVAFVLATFGFHYVQIGAIAGPLDLRNFWLLATASFLLALLIAFVCEGLFATTLGKLLFGLVVRNARGGYAGLGRALTRSVFRPVDLLLIGPLLALATPKRQRLGDIAAGTVVSQTRFAPIMTFVAAAAIAAIGYAEIVWGGGVASAISVAAQSLATGSDLAQKFKAAEPNLPAISPSPLISAPAVQPEQPSAAPNAEATSSPSNADATPQAQGPAGALATGAPSTDQPADTPAPVQ